MTLRRIDDPQNDLERRMIEVMNGVPIITKMPEPEYVVTYGCGAGLIFRPDGSVVEYEDHQPGCEHEQANDHQRLRLD